MPQSWPVHGTTGYNFANVVNGLFVDIPRQVAARSRVSLASSATTWSGRIRRTTPRCWCCARRWPPSCNVLANQLARIAQTDRHTRDFTLTNLRQALTDVIAAFPVYRTYVTDSGFRRGSPLHRMGHRPRAQPQLLDQHSAAGFRAVDAAGGLLRRLPSRITRRCARSRASSSRSRRR